MAQASGRAAAWAMVQPLGIGRSMSCLTLTYWAYPPPPAGRRPGLPASSGTGPLRCPVPQLVPETSSPIHWDSPPAGIEALPLHQVRTIEGGVLDFDQHLIRLDNWIGHTLPGERTVFLLTKTAFIPSPRNNS